MAILAGFVVFAGGMAIAGAGYAGTAGDQEYYALGAGLLFILAVISIISGVIDLIIGILGVRGANNPDKIGPFVVFAFCSSFQICCVVLANNIRKLRQ